MRSAAARRPSSAPRWEGPRNGPRNRPQSLSQYRLAKETGIPAQRIGQIILGRRRVTADTDLRLCRYFGLMDGYWLRAQMAFDLEAEKRRIEPELDKIVPVQQAVAL